MDEPLLRQLASGSRAQLSPMAAALGGVVGQEVVKAASAKFTPLRQWLYFDSVESLPGGVLAPEELAPEVRQLGCVGVWGCAGCVHVLCVWCSLCCCPAGSRAPAEGAAPCTRGRPPRPA